MTDPAASSRILTLVFTDLADSTALKTQRGDEAVGELIGRHRALVRALAAETGGRIIDWAGDGCFLTFETPSAAVTFALQLQLAHHEAPDLLSVRTGIHMGEVSERAGPDDNETHPRIEGLAVDLAARIAALANPAQILVSAAVADSARQRIDKRLFRQPVRWQAYGSYDLKGFDEPLDIREAGLDGIARFVAPSGSEKAAPATPRRISKVRRRIFLIAFMSLIVAGSVAAYFLLPNTPQRFTVTNPSDAPRTAGAISSALDFSGRPAIAVLPFDNMSTDPDQAFFADGLAEDLITRLSMWRSFPVIARNSSFQYRGGNLDLKKVSAELGAHYLVEGSVRRAGNQIRVTAQLIDASSGEHVWAETFDREVKDLFTLQDEITSIIAASVAGDVSRAEGERAHRKGTEDLEAWSLYQLALRSADKFTREGSAEARRLLAQALERDPRFATALARLAWIESMEVWLGWVEAPERRAASVIERARRALELDSREPIGHVALAAGYSLVGQIKDGLDSARRAVDLNPSMPEAWHALSWLDLLSGDPEGCVASETRAQQLDPQGPVASAAYDNMSAAYWEMGRYRESLEAARRLVAARPTYYWGYMYIALNEVALGHLDEARAAIIEARRVQPNISIDLIQRSYGVSRPDVDAKRNAALREAGLE